MELRSEAQGGLRPTDAVLRDVLAALDSIDHERRAWATDRERLDLVTQARLAARRLDALVGTMVAEAGQAGSAEAATGMPMTTLLSQDAQTSPQEAAGLVFAGQDLAARPGLRDAALAGELAVAHVRAINTVIRDLPELSAEEQARAEAILVKRAATTAPRDLRKCTGQVLAEVRPNQGPEAELARLDARTRRARAKRGLSFFPDGDGSTVIQGSLATIDAAPFEALITAYVESDRRAARDRRDFRAEDRSPAQRRADALMAIVATHQRPTVANRPGKPASARAAAGTVVPPAGSTAAPNHGLTAMPGPSGPAAASGPSGPAPMPAPSGPAPMPEPSGLAAMPEPSGPAAMPEPSGPAAMPGPSGPPTRPHQPEPTTRQGPSDPPADSRFSLPSGPPMPPEPGPTGGGSRTRVVVTIREAELRARAEQAGILGSGDAISAGDLRRLCCDADLMPVVLGAASEILDVGRSSRLVTPGLRRALSVRDGGCVFPGCDVVDARCEAHHVVPWFNGGLTALDNLVLLCAHHHALVEPPRFFSGPAPDRWELVLDTSGRADVLPPTRVDPHRTPVPCRQAFAQREPEPTRVPDRQDLLFAGAP